jgi:hypothetical protein
VDGVSAVSGRKAELPSTTHTHLHRPLDRLAKGTEQLVVEQDALVRNARVDLRLARLGARDEAELLRDKEEKKKKKRRRHEQTKEQERENKRRNN